MQNRETMGTISVICPYSALDLSISCGQDIFELKRYISYYATAGVHATWGLLAQGW